MGFFFTHVMDCLPWLTFEGAAKRIGRSRSTIFRMIEAGILVRVYDGFRAKGVTIESIASYESSIAYLNAKETGRVERLSRTAKDLSPLHHVLVTGRYPKPRGCADQRPPRRADGVPPKPNLRESVFAGGRRG